MFNGKEIKELIFDELPYKAYDAKVTRTPQLSYIPFDENGKTIYKGTGKLTFTCYFPFGHTTRTIEKLYDGKYVTHYFPEVGQPNKYPTFSEWSPACNLLKSYEKAIVAATDAENTGLSGEAPARKYVKTYYLINRGELEAPFELKIEGYVPKGSEIKIGNNKIRIDESCFNLFVNTQTGQITASPPPYNWSGKTPFLHPVKAIVYSGDPFKLTIPVGEQIRMDYTVYETGNSTVFDVFVNPNNYLSLTNPTNSQALALTLYNSECICDYQFWYY